MDSWLSQLRADLDRLEVALGYGTIDTIQALGVENPGIREVENPGIVQSGNLIPEAGYELPVTSYEPPVPGIS